MKAICPNDPTHCEFVTVAQISEDWVVDAGGNFIEEPQNPEREVVHGPSPENTWTCRKCGGEARVTR